MVRHARLVGLAVAALAGLAACGERQDDPTTVSDLRVLAVRFETPEVLLRACNMGLLAGMAARPDAGTGGGGLPREVMQALAQDLARPLTMTTLIADPAGGGRPLRYRVLACTSQSDRRCAEEGRAVELAQGETTAGELTLTMAPGAALLPDGRSLIEGVINDDVYKGLGGFRVPVVLDVRPVGGDERVFAQKLMVYMCHFFPQMEENRTPLLHGFSLEGQPWAEDEVRVLTGRGPFTIEPDDFSADQEHYVLPSLELKPVDLDEAWKVSWYTSLGTMNPGTTGGADVSGGVGRHRGSWTPPTDAAAQDVTFTFVVRDGRGGNSWVQRRARWSP